MVALNRSVGLPQFGDGGVAIDVHDDEHPVLQAVGGSVNFPRWKIDCAEKKMPTFASWISERARQEAKHSPRFFQSEPDHLQHLFAAKDPIEDIIVHHAVPGRAAPPVHKLGPCPFTEQPREQLRHRYGHRGSVMHHSHSRRSRDSLRGSATRSQSPPPCTTTEWSSLFTESGPACQLGFDGQEDDPLLARKRVTIAEPDAQGLGAAFSRRSSVSSSCERPAHGAHAKPEYDQQLSGTCSRRHVSSHRGGQYVPRLPGCKEEKDFDTASAASESTVVPSMQLGSSPSALSYTSMTSSAAGLSSTPMMPERSAQYSTIASVGSSGSRSPTLSGSGLDATSWWNDSESRSQVVDRDASVASTAARGARQPLSARSSAARSSSVPAAATRTSRQRVQGLMNFKKTLRARYGNYPRAWRLAFRPKSCFADVCRADFCQYARSAGIANIVGAWNELDADGSGSISLYEICSQSADELRSFKGFLEKLENSAEAVWNNHFCAMGSVRTLSPETFTVALERMGWTVSPAKIFRYLTADHSRAQIITVEDLVWLGLASDSSYARECRFWKPDIQPAHLQANSLWNFVDWLRRVYKNPVRGWRHAVIAAGTMGSTTLSRDEFSRAVRAKGYNGSIRVIWKEMRLDDRSDSRIGLWNLMPEEFAQLADLRDFFLEHASDVEELWESVFEFGNRPYISEDDFPAVCESLGWQRGGLIKAHRRLESNGVVYKSDLVWLGIPAAQLPEKPSPREDVKARKAKEMLGSRTDEPHKPMHFKEFLWTEYGNAVRAWRLGLDQEEKFLIMKPELLSHVGALGYVGDFDELWKEVCGDNAVFCSLHSLAPYLTDEILGFQAHLQAAMYPHHEKFTEVQRLLRSSINTGSNTDTQKKEMAAAEDAGILWKYHFGGELDSLSIQSFERACFALGWTRDPVRLGGLLASDSHGRQVRRQDLKWVLSFPGTPRMEVNHGEEWQRRLDVLNSRKRQDWADKAARSAMDG
eukprot:TRINITY_DN80947_c0_g1_i1.p1 TRINITY_DN80947_c0_g1~~TRINITY_DN80947_c0_g1_i1.p1  ORF type:complete len:986 (-),score=137.20 TRINITY_DN80947_c0_g1_i1:500-3457(-)